MFQLNLPSQSLHVLNTLRKSPAAQIAVAGLGLAVGAGITAGTLAHKALSTRRLRLQHTYVFDAAASGAVHAGDAHGAHEGFGVGLAAADGAKIVNHACASFETSALKTSSVGDPSLQLEQANGPLVLTTIYSRYGKRACDLIIGVAALPIVGLVITACAVAITLEDRGPIFYNAPRVGKGGRDFTMYKLRSMKVDAPDLVMEDGSTYNGADDPRMTRVGAFMRRTSLDEIPQFLNVLKGDMSVVGPRPDLRRETELYRGNECMKLMVKPGITGYAAVYGRNSLPWHSRLALDVEYVQKLSFKLDVQVFFRTFLTVFAQEGIYVEEEPKISADACSESDGAGANLRVDASTDADTNANAPSNTSDNANASIDTNANEAINS